MKSTYTRGSYIHRALLKISREPINEQILRKDIASISVNRFYESVIRPLIADDFVQSKAGVLYITEAGQKKVDEMGPIKDKLPPQRAEARRISTIGSTYKGLELLPQQNRPNGNDHLSLPSRTGNTLRYRDGRVVEMA